MPLDQPPGTGTARIQGIHGFRYQVADVVRAVAFYTNHLGFTVKHQQLPAFANVTIGGIDLLLSGPGASGSPPCQTASGRRRAAGIVSSCAWTTCPPS